LASNVASCVMLTDPALPAALLADGSDPSPLGVY